jgi:hypothetical protein
MDGWMDACLLDQFLDAAVERRKSVSLVGRPLAKPSAGAVNCHSSRLK